MHQTQEPVSSVPQQSFIENKGVLFKNAQRKQGRIKLKSPQKEKAQVLVIIMGTEY